MISCLSTLRQILLLYRSLSELRLESFNLFSMQCMPSVRRQPSTSVILWRNLAPTGPGWAVGHRWWHVCWCVSKP